MRKIDRFDLYMKAKGLNDNKVTNMLGLTVGVIGKSRKAGRDLSPRVVKKILQYFPDINHAWLIAGEGKMLIESEQNPGVKERLIQFIEYKHLSKNRFETTCELSPRYVSNISRSIGQEVIKKISLNFPELNTGWLLTGEGSMLKEQNIPIPEDLEKIYKDKIASLEGKVEMLTETIATQKQLIEDQKWLIDSLRSQIMRLEAKKTEAPSVCRPGVTTDGDSLSSPKGV